MPPPDAIDTAPPPTSVSLESQYQSPRPDGSLDPLSGRLCGDTQGQLGLEKQWTRAYVNETHLWFDQVPAVNSAFYAVSNTVQCIQPSNNAAATKMLAKNSDLVTIYLNSQRTPAPTASSVPKDQFHFTDPTEGWAALAGAGAATGFGVDIALVAASAPRKAVVAFTTAVSGAAQSNIAQGAMACAAWVSM